MCPHLTNFYIMNKTKFVVLALLALCLPASAFAGGILTNTNQSARFARLMSLEAATKGADIAYYNPAGTVKLGEGLHFTFSNQSAFQKRIITATNPAYIQSYNRETTKRYEGTASAPIIPSIQGVYKKGKWALSGSVAVTGGGGKATFSDGLSLFETAATQVPTLISTLTSGAMKPDRYSVDQYMTGSNFIYGAQLGGAYEINSMFSVYGGFRLSIVNNKYEGYLRNLETNIGQGGAMSSPSPILEAAIPQLEAAGQPQSIVNAAYMFMKAGQEGGAQLNSKQTGWGVAPIVGFNFSYGALNIGAKYEFKTSLNVENKTTVDDTGKNNTGMFGDGVNSDHDVPALFTIGASYKILPQLSANIGYHYFFDKDAGMDKGKQKALKGGTNEYLFGLEYQIDKMFLLSAGGQITRYGVTDEFQSDLSFSVNSYSLGFGGAVNVSKSVQINVGYFFTDYTNYEKAMGGDAKNIYTRTNKVFAAGVDFTF